VLQLDVAAHIDVSRWPRPAIFDWLQRKGHVADDEMHRTFNCGIGMVAIVAAGDARAAIDAFAAQGVEAFEIGAIVARAAGAPQAVVA
jgi:phosphoribosylformylglycinamidine cyclo-ligase